MALPSNYRWIVIGNLKIKNKSHKNMPYCPSKFSIQELLNLLKNLIDKNKQYLKYYVNSRIMWCSHLDEDKDYYKLILHIGDKNVADSSYLDFDTMKTRDFKKEDTEGGHCSSHIIIKKNADRSGSHLILIEKVPGVSLASVKYYLAWIFKDQKVKKEIIDAEGKKKIFSPVIDIYGYQSQTIAQALHTGTVQDLEFIKYEENYDGGLDERSIITEAVYEAKLKVNKKIKGFQLVNTIFNYFNKRPLEKDNSQVFIKIKTDSGQVKRTEINYREDKILEQAFVQNEIVNDFKVDLPQYYENFRTDMIAKMIDISNRVGST